MTYAQALNAGWRNYDRTWSRGYVSRKTDVDTQEVHVAGGNRKGELYVNLPTTRSTTYHIRQYLTQAPLYS